MDNPSGLRIPDRQHEFLIGLEEELTIPIRMIAAGHRMVVPDIDARDTIENNVGQATTVIDEDYGGFHWNPAQHPASVRDNMEDGLTIVIQGTLGPPRQNQARTVRDIGQVGAGTAGRILLDRITALGDYLLDTEGDPSDEWGWLMNYQRFTVPDLGGPDPEAYAFAESCTMEGIGTVLAYGFQPNRISTGTLENNRIPRDVLYREPIEAALGNLEEVRARQLEQAHERFREHSANRLGTRIREVRGRVSQLEGDRNLHQESLATTQDSLRDEKLTLDTLLAMQSGEQTTIDPDEEWAAIERHDKVEAFTIRQGRFVIDTVELTLTDPETGEQAPLGKFRISFPMTPGSGRGVSIVNQTNAMDDGSGIPRHHPHVAQNRPCFGSAMDEIARLGAAGEVGGMLELLLQYLQTFNPRDDYGRYAGLWFDGEVREREE